ncbi:MULTISPECIES: ammonium transporter [unclassified Lentimicrobium]|uniref:ammonium transporter n=1 Tax=unclassified Lentimicrobium TaxID=2677434 RepID=UPI001553E840|nr:MULTISPECIES: ammonium transporter [unclassified Lentimicrobium]NPD45090.1 ammonium transporter [Lentimicrobium sp. S6]NPD85393.1 ammonium transporter [Lentimicrobium sp. L6]
MKKTLFNAIAVSIFLLGSASSAFALDFKSSGITEVLEVQQYNRAIHIMAMLLIGFGFLMVFVKNYGKSALTATFLLVSVSLPMYLAISSLSFFAEKSEIEHFILAEFGAASLLIAAGALLGRLKMYQYMILGLLFIPFYILNEVIVLDDHFHFVGTIADTGGSIIIHAFGAIFGISAAVSLSTKHQREIPIEADATSDRYSLLGSMVLWVFWPSFCAALVPAAAIPATVVNVFIALCGSTVATYIASVSIRGKINAADIANAALAGGVAIGATCDHATHFEAMVIGLIAGVISTVGFALLQEKQEKFHKIIDTCGVSNLHGIPGIFGGLAAIVIVDGLDASSQLKAIGVTVIIAIVAGLISGKIISLFGRPSEIYNDENEFED